LATFLLLGKLMQRTLKTGATELLDLIGFLHEAASRRSN